MTGPEHYREAERLLAESRTELRPHDEGHCEADRTIAAAQVHATLALAAAQAAHLADPYIGDGDHINDWRAATGELRTTEPEHTT